MLMLMTGTFSKACKAYRISYTANILSARSYNAHLRILIAGVCFFNQKKTIRSDRLLILISKRDMLVDHTTISNDETTNSVFCVSFKVGLVMASMQSLCKDTPYIT